jgi:homoserine/homoserine lactone efflux protein
MTRYHSRLLRHCLILLWKIMELSNYYLYFSISLLASISIGPSVILAASNGVNFGRKRALAGVLGHVSAVMILALISASGLGVILMASDVAFTVIKYAGACYLVYIGIAIWRSKGVWSFADSKKQIPAKRALFKQSLILGLSNPKALVFFSALFPQFIDPTQAILPQFLLLAGTSLCNAFIFTSIYVVVAFRFREYFLSSISQRWVGKTTGGIFVGFAAALLAS